MVQVQESLSSVSQAANLWRFSLLQGLVVTLLNIVVLPVVSSLATYERHQTTTSYLTVMVFKLTVFYFLNSFAVPIIAYSIAAPRQSWCAPHLADDRCSAHITCTCMGQQVALK